MATDRLFIFDPDTHDALCIGRGFPSGWRTGRDYQDEWFDDHPEWLCEVQSTRFKLMLEHEVHSLSTNVTYEPYPDADERRSLPLGPSEATSRAEFISLEFGEALCARADVDPIWLHNGQTTITELRNESSRTLSVQICAHILEMQNPKKIVHRTPTSWWQMLKRDHAPGWFLKRWPVVESVDTVIIKDIFPFPKMKFPDSLGPRIRIGRIEHDPGAAADD